MFQRSRVPLGSRPFIIVDAFVPCNSTPALGHFYEYLATGQRLGYFVI
jgi:hypothetical protein